MYLNRVIINDLNFNWNWRSILLLSNIIFILLLLIFISFRLLLFRELCFLHQLLSLFVFQSSLLLNYLFPFFLLSYKFGMTVLLLLVPAEQVLQQIFHMNVRNIVVLPQLLTEETFSRTWRARNEDFNRLKASCFLKFLFDSLDIHSHPRLAMPVKI